MMANRGTGVAASCQLRGKPGGCWCSVGPRVQRRGPVPSASSVGDPVRRRRHPCRLRAVRDDLFLRDVDLPALHRHRDGQPPPVAVALHQPEELALEAVGHQRRPVHRLGLAQARRLALPELTNVTLDAAGVNGDQRRVSTEPMQVHHPNQGHAVDQQKILPHEPEGWGFDSLRGYQQISAKPHRNGSSRAAAFEAAMPLEPINVMR